MDYKLVVKKLEGLQTVSTIAKNLNISKRTAINYVWSLRKKGFLSTEQAGRKVRIYRVSLVKKKKVGHSLYDLINSNSKVKIWVKMDYIIHSDKKPSVEEILVRAIITGEFRVILASLGLYNKIVDWSGLMFFARKYNVEKKVGALYDVARMEMKVRKMDLRTRNALLKKKARKEYIIKNVKTKDFKEIEKLWGVYVPFNKADLEVYKD
ncbi:hypothetical protein HYW75_05765 [Candidatus Pacearchaeota archaeon]|nr:hypothetical protein [Candidatus Pacearchaeota archaeon]